MPATGPVKAWVTVAPLHTVWLATAFTDGIGFTVIVNVIGTPGQLTPPVYTGVTVMVATWATFVALVATKLAILPVPDAARPIDVLLLVQLYTVPGTLPLKLMAAVLDPLHNTWLATGLTSGVGFTVMVNVIGVPLQLMPPLVYTGVTVIVATTGLKPIFTAVNEGMLLVPLAASPIDGVVLDHTNDSAPVGPVVGLVKLIAAVGEPLHTTWLATGLTIGVGLTMIVKVIGVPTQPVGPTGVTVIVAVSGPLVVLVVTNGAISPVPLAASPMAVLLLVQLNTVPDTVPPAVPLNGISAVVAPVQYTLLVTGATVGVGLTVMVKVLEGPVQVVPPLV